MNERRQILSDHKKRGKTLVPPFTSLMGPIEEVSWVNTIIPEILWIALIQSRHGHRYGVKLITSMARAARKLRSSDSREIFASISNYSNFSNSEWTQLRGTLAASGELFSIQQSLEPLVTLYPECPLKFIFSTPPTTTPDALPQLMSLVSSLFYRADRDPMLVQATVIWLAFDADVLKVNKGVSLAQFPEIENYPNTEISQKVGSAIRASLYMFFGSKLPYTHSSGWSIYFWNHGLKISPCELSDD